MTDKKVTFRIIKEICLYFFKISILHLVLADVVVLLVAGLVPPSPDVDHPVPDETEAVLVDLGGAAVVRLVRVPVVEGQGLAGGLPDPAVLDEQVAATDPPGDVVARLRVVACNGSQLVGYRVQGWVAGVAGYMEQIQETDVLMVLKELAP